MHGPDQRTFLFFILTSNINYYNTLFKQLPSNHQTIFTMAGDCGCSGASSCNCGSSCSCSGCGK
ncbi:unnamed protein product [Fusarium graminearum]|nr:unnamed protein product [Fusarium graminearum]